MIDVSVVIPTVGRTSLRPAVLSVLNQCSNVEAIVVVDRPSEVENVKLLLSGLDVTLVEGLQKGAATARNLGILHAKGRFVAFLDDDDYWLPGKLRGQLSLLSDDAYGTAFSVGASKFLTKYGRTRRGLAEEPSSQLTLATILFQRTRFLYASSYFQTCSLLVPRVGGEFPKWNESLTKHQDWDYLLSLQNTYNLKISILKREVVVINQGSTNSISKSINFESTLSFFDRWSEYANARSRADFLLVMVISKAIVTKDIETLRQAMIRFPGALPHFSALLRSIAGVVLGA